MRVASSRCSVLDGTVALRSDAPPLWWSATGDLTASRPHVLAHMGHGLRPLLLARVAKNRRCLPPAHRAPAAKTTTSKALLWPVALSDHCSVILFNYSCLELKFWLLLWICYDHYNLSSIILCICFETWHTQPQIPGSATGHVTYHHGLGQVDSDILWCSCEVLPNKKKWFHDESLFVTEKTILWHFWTFHHGNTNLTLTL